MPAPLGDDLRERIVSAVRDGATIREVADVFDVAPSSVVKVHQRWRDTGAVSAKPMGGDRRSHTVEEHGDVVMDIIRVQSDLTLDEICEMLRAKGVEASRSALWRFFDRHDVSFKKNRARQRTGTPGCRFGARSVARETPELGPFETCFH